MANNNTTNTQEMERLVLKKEVLDKIKRDHLLYGKIATLIGLKNINSMNRIMNANDSRLTEASVLTLLKNDLGYSSFEEMLESSVETGQQ